MSLNTILPIFQKEGYKSDSLISKPKMIQILNKLFNNYAAQYFSTITQFDLDIFDQLWNECQTNSKDQVILIRFIEIIELGRSTLIKKIKHAQKIHDEAIQERNRCLQKFNIAKEVNNDLEMNNLTQKINRKSFQIKEQKNKITEFQYDLKMISLTFGFPLTSKARQAPFVSQQPQQNIFDRQQKFSIHKSTYPQQQQIYTQQQNGQLKTLFWLIVTFLLVQLFIQFKHPNFLNTLIGLLFISIFFLDYFDKVYKKFLLGVASISILFDLIWIVLKLNSWWNPNSSSPLSSLNLGFLRFIIIMLFFIILLKIPIIWLLYILGKQTQNNVYLIRTLNYEIKIKINRNNPLTNILIPNNEYN